MSESFHSKSAQTQPVRRYEPAPQGVCEVEIIKAERKAVPWRATDANPTGECIALRLRASAEHAFVFVDLPDDKPWVRQHVARAVGLAGELAAGEELIGRRARVEIGHVTTRDGSTRAVVKKWLPLATSRQTPQESTTLADCIGEWANQPPPATRPAASRRKPVQSHEPDDDIPF